MNSNIVMIVGNATRGVTLALVLAVAGLAPATAIGNDAELLKTGALGEKLQAMPRDRAERQKQSLQSPAVPRCL